MARRQRKDIILEGKEVTLRRLRLSDADDLYRNVRDKEVTWWTRTIPHPFPRDLAPRFIRRSQHLMRTGKAYLFGIVPRDVGRVSGVISLANMDLQHRHSEVGYWLGRRHWGRGIMTEAVSLVVDFAFTALRLNRLYAHFFEGNDRSRGVLEANGFVLEGTARRKVRKDGEWRDEYLYGLLASDRRR